jgi:hypothetical protein
MIPDGVFPAVALSGGLGTLAVREGTPREAGDVVAWRFPYADPTALTEIARVALPAGSPCFPGLYVLDGLTWLAFHDGERQRLRILETGRDVLAIAGLSNQSAFGAGCFAYTEPVQPYRVHRINLRTDARDQPRLGAPTGLSRILEDGRVVTIDEDRHALPGATIPSFAGPLAVGEGPSGGAVWSFRPPTSDLQPSTFSGTLWPGLNSFTPKCADDGSTLAITAAGSGSVRLFCGTLAMLMRERGPIVNGAALKKCEVTVDAFALSPANKLPDGTILEFHDRENAIGTRARVWVENGSARMSIDYPGAGPGLKGETGARRPVR